MTVTFPNTPESLTEGAKAFYVHRHQSHLNIVVVALAASLFILFFFILDAKPGIRIPVAILLGAAIWGQWGTRRAIAKTVENAFEGKPHRHSVSLIFTDDFISATNGESEATTIWSTFVDFKICETGILIYPQKNIFNWIPKTAEIEGGTWEDLVALISNRISKKI